MSEFLRYLRQLRDLYGDELYLDPAVPAPAAVQGAETFPQAGKTVGQPTSARGGNEDAQFLFQDDMTPHTHPWAAATSLETLNGMICGCLNCPLGHTRKNFVFGVGSPAAEVVIVGEAPGAEEDAQGEPFVGRAGRLLNDILAAVRLKREEVYICNILKCRPPNNRDPLPSEVEQCEPYLHHQLKLIRPKIMLALGRIAAQTLLRTNNSLTALRASTHEYQGIPLVVTYHPAALLRNPNWKKPTWDDMKRFRALYDELTGRA